MNNRYSIYDYTYFHQDNFSHKNTCRDFILQNLEHFTLTFDLLKVVVNNSRPRGCIKSTSVHYLLICMYILTCWDQYGLRDSNFSKLPEGGTQ